jgi:hypothetical protein
MDPDPKLVVRNVSKGYIVYFFSIYFTVWINVQLFVFIIYTVTDGGDCFIRGEETLSTLLLPFFLVFLQLYIKILVVKFIDSSPVNLGEFLLVNEQSWEPRHLRGSVW